MTDDFNAYYTAFCENFPAPATKLLCQWHTHRAWKIKILKYVQSESAWASDARNRTMLWRSVCKKFVEIEYLHDMRSLPGAAMLLRSYLQSRHFYGLFRYFQRRSTRFIRSCANAWPSSMSEIVWGGGMSVQLKEHNWSGRWACPSTFHPQTTSLKQPPINLTNIIEDNIAEVADAVEPYLNGDPEQQRQMKKVQ